MTIIHRSTQKIAAFILITMVAACGQPNTLMREAVDNFALDNEIDSAAHWVEAGIILLPDTARAGKASLIVDDPTVDPGEIYATVALSETSMPSELATKLPHLSSWKAFRVDLSRGDIIDATKSRLIVVRSHSSGIEAVHNVQTSFVLDDLYTSGTADADEQNDFGATIIERDPQTGWPSEVSIRLWAPTARSVSVILDGAGETSMQEDTPTGIWSATVQIPTEYRQDYPAYQYEITAYHPTTDALEVMTVSDPWSLSLTSNGRQSVIVDLNDPAIKPEGWDSHNVPTVSHPEAQILYEAHIGDFSGMDTSTPASARGRYSAFQYRDSAPMQHLKRLVDAGLTSFHILPAYDIGTVDEDKDAPVRLTDSVAKACALISETPDFCRDVAPDTILLDLLKSYDPLSTNSQAVINAIDEVDDYNWGYDPVHYTVPEGSYASDSDGPTRTLEFREMVKTLHDMGLRVVMDVAYNHTFTAGQDRHSVLDRIVPGYWHRRHPITGAVETSTCCPNTATERAMMGKLMTDSLVVWARDYKVDGFRFDLMGHQPKALMLAARAAVRAVDPDTYFYGEGWDFGEVANNAQFVQASQNELGGTSIGTFSDRLRDAVRGGGPSLDGEALRQAQGLGNGLFLIPNDLTQSGDHATYDTQLNIARLGLAGNLASYPLEDITGQTVLGNQLQYGGGPAGYALDPADTINYVSKHDNQTLWDNHQYRLPADMTLADRARLHVQSLSWALYAQGIPFIHMGSEMLRSKSFLRDSYNYGHWFNRIDFTGQTTTYNVGLPPAEKDAVNWSLITKLLNRNEGRDVPTTRAILDTRDWVLDMIKIRSSSPLFSLQSETQIRQRVSFLNSGPDQIDGLVVMQIDDGFVDADIRSIDPNWSSMIIIFNHSAEELAFPHGTAGDYKLHPVLEGGSDPVVKTAKAGPTGFAVPPLTTAVFVQAGTVKEK